MELSPKEQAHNLVFSIYKKIGLDGFNYDCNPINIIDNGLHKIAQQRTIELALMQVDEIINESGFYKDLSSYTYPGRLRYWGKVKKQINNYKI